MIVLSAWQEGLGKSLMSLYRSRKCLCLCIYLRALEEAKPFSLAAGMGSFLGLGTGNREVWVWFCVEGEEGRSVYTSSSWCRERGRDAPSQQTANPAERQAGALTPALSQAEQMLGLAIFGSHDVQKHKSGIQSIVVHAVVGNRRQTTPPPPPRPPRLNGGTRSSQASPGAPFPRCHLASFHPTTPSKAFLFPPTAPPLPFRLAAVTLPARALGDPLTVLPPCSAALPPDPPSP